MSDDLDFIVIDDIPEYTFCIPDDEELENVIPIKGEDGSFKYEKVAELPETGEDGVLYLVPKSHETQTASGNPISINVTEGAGKLSDLKHDGAAGQQTYSGKNKMPMADADMTGEGEAGRNKTFRMALPAGTYTVSFDLDSFELGTNTAFGVYMQIYASSATALIDLAIINIGSTTATGRKSITFTINEDATTDRSDNIRIALTNWNNGARAKISNIQIESGSSASSYEPYVGGTASPNPDYPQNINVVTGTQTIDINGTSYPINLGDIWLAEVGAHQDGIKKTDGKWYVEKQVGKVVLDGSETWVGGGTFGNYWRSSIPIADIKPIASNVDFVGLSDHFHKDTGVFSTATIQEGMFCQFRGDTRVYFACPISVQSASDWATWLSTHPTTVYYALATPTTTQITDTNLINQLEAARNAALANGTNVISNTATGNNLAGDLELSYYEYDPTNKYNKWLWLDDDAAYEQM